MTEEVLRFLKNPQNFQNSQRRTLKEMKKKEVIQSPLLILKNVSKNFGGIKALNNVSFSVPHGKIIAVIGPNGSGKSTLFHVISGLYELDRGEIYFQNENITGLEDFIISRKGISRTFQEVRLFKHLTVREHLEIALQLTDEKLFASLFRAQFEHETTIQELLKLFKLDNHLKNYAHDLSYGQRKLLDLAVALAKPHKILMLDEPVAGIHHELRVEIAGILKNLRKRGETILLIEHDMNFVMNLADYIYVLDYGKVIASGKPREIKNNEKVLEAYLGK
ncbi:MAG: ABC transporter ATP-binding protein [Nanoarchaeota archaeon]